MHGVAILLIAASIFSPSWQAEWSYEEVFTVDHFFGQINDIAFGAPGELVVLDGGNVEFLVLDDSTGEIIRRVGRRGEGPGEFSQPDVFAASESGEVVVFDTQAGYRLTAFRPDGTYAKATTVSRDEVPNGISFLSNGMLWYEASPRLPARFQQLSGRFTTAEHPTLSLRTEDGHFRQFWEWKDILPMELDEIAPLRAHGLWSVLPDSRIAVASSHKYLVTILDPSGNEVGRIRREVERQPVTEEYKERLLAAFPDRLVHFDPYIPILLGIFPGPRDTIMVQRPPFDGAGFGLDIFSNSGDYLGIVQLPEAFLPMTGHGGLVAGVEVTSDLEYVVRVVRVRK